MEFKIGEIYTLDNIIPNQYQDFILHHMLHTSEWSLGGLPGQTSYKKGENYKHLYSPDNLYLKENIEENNQVVCPIFGCQNPDSIENFSIFLPILHYINHYFEYSFLYIPLKIKANTQFQQSNINPKKTCIPHVDVEVINNNNYTIVYYFNDSDGDTTIFNEEILDIPIKNFSIKKNISPKKGRCVMFPSKYFHAGRFPILSEYRMVLNLNILIK